MNVILHVEFIDLLLQLVSQLSFASNNKANWVARVNQSRNDVNQMMKSFFFGKSSDGSDQKSLRIEAETSLIDSVGGSVE